MAIDRPSGEAVEQSRAADAPQPPPPPDTPGAEGFPSRAESRAFAAAAAEKNRRRNDADAADTSSVPDAVRGEQDGAREDRTERPKASEHTEPDAGDGGAVDSPYDTGDDLQDDGPQQSSSPDQADATERVDGDRTSADAAALAESADHRALGDEETDTDEPPALVDAPAETADARRPDDLGPPSDHPGAEPEEPPSRAEISTGADAAVVDTGRANETADAEGLDRGPDVERTAEPFGGPLDAGTDTVDQGDEGTPADDRENSATAADRVRPADRVQDVDGTADAAEERAQRYEPGGDGAEPEGKGDGQDGASSGSEDLPDLKFMVGDQPVRVPGYLDSVRARAWSDDVGDQVIDPSDRAGARTVDEVNDKQSRRERARREVFKTSETAVDRAGRTADAVEKLKPRPPTGHPETRTCPPAPAGPEYGPGRHDGLSAGDTLTTLLSTGIVIGEIGRRVYGRMDRRRGA